MKILIIGASGQVGLALYKEHGLKGHTVLGTYFESNNKYPKNVVQMDITNFRSLNAIKEYSPDVVYLASANTNVDFCEKNPQESFKTNVKSVKYIADICDKIRTKLVFFSTDYVFDGIEGNYNERSVPNPICEYGKQKLISEFIVLTTNSKNLVIRTNAVYGNDVSRKNFVLRLKSNLEAGAEVKIPSDEYCTPTYTSNLAKSASELALKKESSGVYHITGNELISRYNFARKIAEVFQCDSSLIEPVFSEALGRPARRPKNGGLVSVRLDLTSHGNCEENLKRFQKNYDVIPEFCFAMPGRGN